MKLLEQSSSELKRGKDIAIIIINNSSTVTGTAMTGIASKPPSPIPVEKNGLATSNNISSLLDEFIKKDTTKSGKVGINSKTIQ